MPNASDFSRRVDIPGEQSESFVNGGDMPELEFNSRIIAGERLAIRALIARSDRP